MQQTFFFLHQNQLTLRSIPSYSKTMPTATNKDTETTPDETELVETEEEVEDKPEEEPEEKEE